jgi:hypothetical protein
MIMSARIPGWEMCFQLSPSVRKISPKRGISASERVCIRQIAHKGRVLEGHIGRAEVSVGESRFRSSR